MNAHPKQALAVFELLDDLRDRLWAVHGDQALLQQEQSFAVGGLQSNEPNGDGRSS